MDKRKSFIFIFPGQGSQYVGMGRALFYQFPEVRELFHQASESLKLDLKSLCFEGPEETLIKTENVQPAITLVNVSCFHVLKKIGIFPAGAAGHSLGEYSALYAAGSISFLDTMKLVQLRGKFMQEVADNHPGAMVAVLGIAHEKLQTICERASRVGSVEVANLNSPKQVILSGDMKGVEEASRLAKEGGAKRVIPLKVSGPWHSRFMGEAQKKMEGVLEEISIRMPNFPVITNFTADYETDPAQIKNNLIRQISSPVRWMESMDRFIRGGYRTFIEVGPGKVLSRLMKEINGEVKAMNFEKPESVSLFLQHHPG